jgi:hypothetical protein
MDSGGAGTCSAPGVGNGVAPREEPVPAYARVLKSLRTLLAPGVGRAAPGVCAGEPVGVVDVDEVDAPLEESGKYDATAGGRYAFGAGRYVFAAANRPPDVDCPSVAE